jgi:drug/metabolite transporter (DMT)-like permease
MKTPHASPPRAQYYAAFAAIYLFWGATFLAIRYIVAEVPPLLTVTIRCAMGALILFGWLAFRRQLTAPTGAQWRTAILAGLFLFLGCHALLAWAEQRVSSGQAALFSTSIPLWMLLLEGMRRRELPSALALLGVALGTAGVAVLAGGEALHAGTTTDRALLIASAFAWAAGSLIGRHGARPEAAAMSTAMQLTAGAGWVFLACLQSGELTRWSIAQVSTRSVVAMLFLVVCGTVLAFGAYTWLLRVASPALVSTYAFINPMVALSLGWLVGDDRITVRIVLAAALVIAAVALTTLATAREAQEQRENP